MRQCSNASIIKLLSKPSELLLVEEDKGARGGAYPMLREHSSHGSTNQQACS
ncbi:MAG: hypothetical protein LBF65_00325 [Holosporales bacterium]|nr:hypothetical protein [Holosporales bacterium]